MSRSSSPLPAPRRLGPAHPLALILVVLVMGAGFFAFALRWNDRMSDGIYHLAFAIQMALLPPLYGIAHNSDRPIWKAAILLAFGALTAGVAVIYADLAPPREVPVPGGWQLRAEAPEYLLPPVLFVIAWSAMVGHWGVSAVRRRRRGGDPDGSPDGSPDAA